MVAAFILCNPQEPLKSFFEAASFASSKNPFALLANLKLS